MFTVSYSYFFDSTFSLSKLIMLPDLHFFTMSFAALYTNLSDQLPTYNAKNPLASLSSTNTSTKFAMSVSFLLANTIFLSELASLPTNPSTLL